MKERLYVAGTGAAASTNGQPAVYANVILPDGVTRQRVGPLSVTQDTYRAMVTPAGYTIVSFETSATEIVNQNNQNYFATSRFDSSITNYIPDDAQSFNDFAAMKRYADAHNETLHAFATSDAVWSYVALTSPSIHDAASYAIAIKGGIPAIQGGGNGASTGVINTQTQTTASLTAASSGTGTPPPISSTVNSPGAVNTPTPAGTPVPATGAAAGNNIMPTKPWYRQPTNALGIAALAVWGALHLLSGGK